MKNYLYKFEFRSGLFESYFFRQVRAENEKKALVEIVSTFLNTTTHEANHFIRKSLGLNWSIEKFWEKMDTRFFSEGDMEAYELIFVKEVKFNLDEI